MKTFLCYWGDSTVQKLLCTRESYKLRLLSLFLLLFLELKVDSLRKWKWNLKLVHPESESETLKADSAWKWNLPRKLEPTIAVAVVRTAPTTPTYLTATKNFSFQQCNSTVLLLPGQASLAQVEKGGSWRVVQFSSSGDNDGTPIGLQQHTM